MLTTTLALALAGAWSGLVAASQVSSPPPPSLIIQLPANVTIPGPRSYARLYSPDSSAVCADSQPNPIIAPLTIDNTFEIDIPPCRPESADAVTRSYLVSVDSPDVAFPQMRIDITTTQSDKILALKASTVIPGNAWNERGADVVVESAAAGGTFNIRIPNGGIKDHYVKKSGFVILSFLKNPMVLMALGTLFLAVVMPKMLDLVDPETKEEFKEFQKKKSQGGIAGSGPAPMDPANMLSKFDPAAWLAGAPAAAPAPPALAPVSAKSGKANRSK